MFSSERIRLSAKIETAAVELDEARGMVPEKAEGWTSRIQYWSANLALLTEGAYEGEGHKWFEELYSYDTDPVKNTAQVVAVAASNTRLSKLSSGSSLLASNEAKAEEFVLSENDIAIELSTATKDKKLQPVPGVEVTIRDIKDPYATDIVRTTDKDGRIVLLSNLFKADDNKRIHLRLDVNGEALGYRSFGVEECRIKQGQAFKGTLVPLDDNPYIYSASFHGYDMFGQEFDMLYSSLNDFDFDIKVVTRNPGGEGLTPPIQFAYWKKDGYLSWKYNKHLVEPTTHEENTYVFRGPWKKNLTPWVGDNENPYFTFDASDSDEKMRAFTRLKSIKGAVDAPVEKGTLAFVNVMGKGLSVKFNIPGSPIPAAIKVDVPIDRYLPTFIIDQSGFYSIVVGSPLIKDKMKQSSLNWQNKELQDLKENEEAAQKEGWFADYKAKEGVAYKYYTSDRTTFLRESKIELGMFAMLCYRWTLDNTIEDVKATTRSVRAGFGMLLKYSYSWTVRGTLGPVPLYLTLMLSITAGFQLNFEVAFGWVNDSFHDWAIRPVRDVTVTIGFSFTAIAGVGVKGFFDLWVRFVAGLDFRLHFALMDTQEKSTFSGSYYVNATVGGTMFWLTLTATLWETSGSMFDPVPLGNAAPPLQQYALANAGPEEQEAVSQEPVSYTGLVPTAKEVKLSGSDPRARTRVAVIGGQTYLFYLANVTGKDGQQHMRLSWVNADNSGKAGTTQTAIDAWDTSLNSRNDYAFDVRVADGYVFVLAACAAEFDGNGNPKPNVNLEEGNQCNQIFYLTMLRPDGSGNLTATLDKGYYRTGFRQPMEGEQPPKNELVDHVLVTGQPVGYIYKNIKSLYYYDSIDEPEITWARAIKEGGSPTCLGAEIFGTFGRVIYSEKDTPYGITSFELIPGSEGVRCFNDQFVESGMGADYVRTEVHGAMRCSNTQPKVHDSSVDEHYSPGFLALSQPKNGGEGDRAIEMFDFEMNGVNYTGRESIVLERGDIEHFELVQTAVDGDGANYRRMVFYTAKETSDDGAEQSRLYGLYLEPLRRDGRELTFDVTKYTYDLTVPAEGRFCVTYIGDVPYLYWLTTAPRRSENDPDTYRVMISAYDMTTNTMTAPAVYAEFQLPKYRYQRDILSSGSFRYTLDLNQVPQNLILTGTGTAYLSAVADIAAVSAYIEKGEAPQSFMPKVPRVAFFSFPVQMKPLLELKNLFFEDTTVCMGEFEDANIVLMNAGNMGISSFDLELYTVENGQANVAETIHADCLNPAKSTLKMAGKTEYEYLPENAPVIYRENDFDYTARQREWVLAQEKKQYHVFVGSRVVLDSVKTVESDTRFIKTDMLMPGAMASFIGTLKIPETWSGEKTLYLRVAKISTYSNWVQAMANAAGAKANGIVSNAEAPEELTWVLDEATDRMVLETGQISPNGLAANAVHSGIIANAVEAPRELVVAVADQDLDVDYRVYGDIEGEDMLDIIISNYTATEDSFKLTCAVYLDREEEPYFVNLPYYAGGMANRITHTITMPVSALVPDQYDHYQARVVISAVDREESAVSNNEFTVYLRGGALHVTEQPVSQTVQEGEDVTFSVGVGGGVKPYTYQWQIWDEEHRKWVDLPGFTEPTLSRKDVEKEWDGARFRCVITDETGAQVITDEVKLTVRDGVSTGDKSNLPLYLAAALVALLLLWVVRRRMRQEI